MSLGDCMFIKVYELIGKKFSLRIVLIVRI